jgi:hypothetical protein
VDASKDNRPLAERLDDPATSHETNERLGELADMIANYDSRLIDTAEYEARIRELYADLFG